ncbi:Uncharacterised protein [Mycobacteroides abscessus subsp. abscessus]|uniref:hypothetical protein n=1 Tax=Mycobacteroides abscessus TaxID=36809 RepID=UPI00092594B4|nr:hypothetical protein [Mycobacteroides abscessus]MDO3312381.1 hypothetical protein [Mycobacteroides abscessus subsp. abscessus]MDO3344937.1 hypothetical protein [Mycobacteroides abscessus subsp. abscessus]SHP09750.1 Uncharacterised protein [Mycobacteroides abscessus subsp. abscessus]SHP23720.1 Uncharacterised protein [Mycobacteroides abscessus subsp. abscessus]SHP94605.1 Uncharacterised protein [Mycobacteroides abscessus subsp. abscessus]
MTTIEDNVAAAQHEVDRRKADYERARDLYRRAVAVRDDLDAVAAESAEQAEQTRTSTGEGVPDLIERVAFARAKVSKWQERLNKYQAELTELRERNRHKLAGMLNEGPDTCAPTLDSDPRTPDEQAHEFFTRPGDFYQVRLAIPLDRTEFGQKLNAQFMVKADDTQLPYLLEVLRQLRGALGGNTRVELGKAEIGLPVGPPTVPGPIGAMTRYTEVFAPPEPSISDQITEIAEQQGVKPEQVQAIPVRGGGHAFTVKPEPQPEHGRHARSDDWESTPTPQHLAADEDQDDDAG